MQNTKILFVVLLLCFNLGYIKNSDQLKIAELVEDTYTYRITDETFENTTYAGRNKVNWFLMFYAEWYYKN